jgi:hypothetical protein
MQIYKHHATTGELLGAGLLEAVNQAFAGMDGDVGVAARIEWEYATSIDRDNPLESQPGKTAAREYATSIDRDNPLFSQLAGALGLTDEQIDDLFRQGATL